MAGQRHWDGQVPVDHAEDVDEDDEEAEICVNLAAYTRIYERCRQRENPGSTATVLG